MDKREIAQKTPKSKPRDDLRTAYGGDENKGPRKNKKSGPTHGRRTKSRRLPAYSAKTPIR